MKKRVRTPWVEFFRTGKFYKYVEPPEPKKIPRPDRPKPINPPPAPKPKPKKYHWEITIYLTDGSTTSFSTVDPDTEDHTGKHAFDAILEWYQCSTNTSYIFRYEVGLVVIPRDKIIKIQVLKKEMKDGKS